MTSRVRNPQLLRQHVDFKGLQYGKLGPTDVDALLDVKGKAWVIIEVKHEYADWPRGQLIALERLASDLMETRPVLAIRAVHRQKRDEVVDLAECRVTHMMVKPLKAYSPPWYPVKAHTTVRELMDVFINEIWEVRMK